MSSGVLSSPEAAARCTTASTPTNAGRIASKSARSARWHSTPVTGRRFNARNVYAPASSRCTAPPMRPESPVTRMRRIVGTWLSSTLQLSIAAEVLGHRRPPAIERIGFREIAGLPRACFRDVVEIMVVLGPRAPRVARVIEEVRADDVTAQTPAGWAPMVQPALPAQRDLVDAADLERAVVEAGPVRLEQGQIVMVGRAAQERDDAVATVGELQPKHARVEVDLPVERAGEEQDVAKASRMRLEPLGAAARRHARDVAWAVQSQRRIRGRHLATLGPDVDRVAVGIGHPQAARGDAAGRV